MSLKSSQKKQKGQMKARSKMKAEKQAVFDDERAAMQTGRLKGGKRGEIGEDGLKERSLTKVK